MLGITTMKLFQQFVADHPEEKRALVNENRSVLIVGMSATALESEQEEAFNYGMHFFCPKPVSLELLTIILDAKRIHHASLDATVDQICEITGTSATDAVITSPSDSADVGIATADAGASASAGGSEHPSSNNNSNGVNPKNKWSFFRSYKQSRGTPGQNTEGNH